MDFMMQGTINRGRHIDHSAGRHSIRTNQCRPPPSPIASKLVSKQPRCCVSLLTFIWPAHFSDASLRNSSIQQIKRNKTNLNTRSTGTMHTSAKARLTSAAIWRISMSRKSMFVNNHFPYLPIVMNPENNAVSRQ